MTILNGADAIIGSLADLGVTVCFANPGTSEMHLVSALDRDPRIRPVLCLFEGVATGAADGFARMTGVPAMTLLHLGPGYANGAANLHNARRAFSPVINIVGDHARSHALLDAPLASDIATMAWSTSIHVATIEMPSDVTARTADAFAQSTAWPRGPATLIVPADCAWLPCERFNETKAPAADRPVNFEAVAAVVDALAVARAPAILLGSQATACDIALEAASRLAGAGIAIYCDTFVSRQRRGGGRFEPRRLPYFGEDALGVLSAHDLLILVGTTSPVSFFAYPDQPGELVPQGMATKTLCTRTDDPGRTLVALADVLDASVIMQAPPAQMGAMPAGTLTPITIGASLARHIPAGSIISDDGVTSSGPVFAALASGTAHDWLCLTGGAIGQGLPVAIGAAIAAPDTRVIALTGDGAAMYTPQSLWTMAREQLDVTVIVFANNAYRILDIEFARTGSGSQGPAATSLLGIGDPAIDWRALARSMGVEAIQCDTAESFDAAFQDSLRGRGPRLIVARIS